MLLLRCCCQYCLEEGHDVEHGLFAKNALLAYGTQGWTAISIRHDGDSGLDTDVTGIAKGSAPDGDLLKERPVV